MPDHTSDITRFNKAPKIKVIFGGFIVSQIKHGNPSAMVGTLADPVCHKPIVHIYKIDSSTDETTDITNDIGFKINVADNFSLMVGTTPNIEVFQKDGEDFNRLDELGNDKKDFRWFTDLEKLHEVPTKLDTTKLKPQFTLNRGLFHTSSLSDGEVRIKRDGKPHKRFGRFGLEISARIDLGATDVAVLKNGTKEFEIKGNDSFRYEIHFDCSCRRLDETKSDFEDIYIKKVILDKTTGEPVHPAKQVKMEASETSPLTKDEIKSLTGKSAATALSAITCTPEVYCTAGNHGG